MIIETLIVILLLLMAIPCAWLASIFIVMVVMIIWSIFGGLKVYYLNVYENNGKRFLGGIFHSKDEQDRYAEMAIVEDGEPVKVVAKLKIDVNKDPIEVAYL